MKSKLFKIALVQNKVIPDKLANINRAKELIEVAVNLHKANVVVLPEMFQTPIGLTQGYIENFAESEKSSETINFLSTTAKKHGIYLIGGSFVEKHEDKYYNTSYSFDRNGDIKAKHRKIHLFDIEIPGKIAYQESSKFSPGDQYTVFDTEYCKFGIGICYDIRFPEYAQILKTHYGVQFLVYPAAFNTVTGPMHWDLLMRSRALDNNVFLANCSQARNYENPKSYQAYGYSQIVNPFGFIVASSTFDEQVVVSQIDLSQITDITEQIPTFKQRRSDLYTLKKV